MDKKLDHTTPNVVLTRVWVGSLKSLNKSLMAQ